MINDSLLIFMSQLIAIPEIAFFCRENYYEILHSRFYQRITLHTKQSDICH